MRPRIHVRLSPDEQRSVARWSRRMSAAAITLLLAVGGWSLVAAPTIHGTGMAYASERPADPVCIAWDTQASEAIVALVHEGGQNIDLARLANAISQMRKARRHCILGFLNLACADYHAVGSTVGATIKPTPAGSIECPAATTGLASRTFDDLHGR